MKKFYFIFILFLLGNQMSAQTKGMVPSGQKMPDGTECRMALVIGNKDYQHISRLNNPINDANDMTENVCEWCSDWYGQYGNVASTNPTGPNSGTHRILRGASWYNSANFCRITN